MSEREHYILFPNDYYDELIEQGHRAKAAAFTEYYRDMKRKRVYKYQDYAKYWFDDYKKKGTAYKWIQVFKYEIELFFLHWQEQNSQHILDVGNTWKPNGNHEETKNTTQTPINRDIKKGVETKRKPLGNNSNKSNRSNNIYTPTSEDLNIAEYLFSKLKKISPNIKKPDFNKWAKHVELMRLQDGRDVKGMTNMIDFIFDDNDIYDGTFWRSNIRSVEKLRKQYDTISIQINLAYKNRKVCDG